MSDHPREVHWYLAKYVRDLERNEPVNVGVIIRPADGMLMVKFKEPGTVSGLTKDAWPTYVESVAKWTDTLNKHGEKCLRWITKRSKKSPRLYIEMAGGRLVGGRVDLDAMFDRLVE